MLLVSCSTSQPTGQPAEITMCYILACSGSLYLLIDAKSLQSCLTLCNPVDGSPSGSPVPGILQARTLEWVAISFSKA